MKTERGLFGKYQITKADGSSVNSFKFVLSPEKDDAALEALKTYAEYTKNHELKHDLFETIKEIETSAEREKAQAYIEKHTDYKVSDIQRVIKKGYIYTAKLLEEMKTERACPISGLPFFMTIEHPRLGFVDTYGGPYDSYTIPKTDDEGNMYRERFDHDEGVWRDSESYEPERACPRCGGWEVFQVRSNYGIGDCPTCHGTGLTKQAREEDRQKRIKEREADERKGKTTA